MQEEIDNMTHSKTYRLERLRDKLGISKTKKKNLEANNETNSK